MIRPVSLALAAGLALAACGGGGGDGDRDHAGRDGPAGVGAGEEAGTAAPAAPTTGTPPPTTDSSAPPSTTPPPTAGRPGGPPRSPTDQVKARRLTGTVATAAGCLVLDTGAGRWALVGGALPAGLAAGSRVEVTARPMPQAESPCGSPVLSVLTLTRL